MRSSAPLAVLVLTLASRCPAAAPDLRYVIVPEAEVRAGPSIDPQLYPTNRLHRGNIVEVVEQRPDGWLAIRPPAGSFSWINTRFLENPDPNQPHHVVSAEGVSVPVLVGSALYEGRPTVIGTHLQRGTLVRGIGRTRTEPDGALMPIEAPASELRYVRMETVARTSPTNLAGMATLAPNGSPAANAPGVAATLTSSGNPSFAPERGNANTSGGFIAENRVAPASASNVVQPTVRLAAPSYPAPYPAASPGTPGNYRTMNGNPSYVTYSGLLHTVGRGDLDNRKTFRLDHAEYDRPIMYLTPEANINLDPYLNRKVRVSGPCGYHLAARAYYMRVVHVEPLP